MKFTAKKSDLIPALDLAKDVADKKSTMPILANVLIRAAKGKATISASDLNITVTSDVPCETTETGAVTVRADVLAGIVRDLSDPDVTIESKDNDWIEVRSGSFKSRLVGVKADDFPRLPSIKDVKWSRLPALAFKELIAKVAFCVSADQTRFQLSGALFECDGKIARMVATDGHRLSMLERAVSEGPILAKGVIVPKPGLDAIKTALGSAAGSFDLAVAYPLMHIRTGEATLSVKLIEAEFPPYQQVIPGKDRANTTASVNRESWMAALKRTGHMASDRTSSVRLTFNGAGGVKVDRENADSGEATDLATAEIGGAKLTVGVNGVYLAEVLKSMEGASVEVEIGGELEPVLMRSASDVAHLAILMPMRL